MASTKLYAGDTWVFEIALTGSDGEDITSLTDAWLSVYTDKDTEAFLYDLSDAEMTLAGNVLTVEVPQNVTELIEDGAYFLDVKIKQADDRATTVVYKQRLRVINDHPLYDNH